MAAADAAAASRSSAGEGQADRAAFLAYINDDESEATLRMGLAEHLDLDHGAPRRHPRRDPRPRA